MLPSSGQEQGSIQQFPVYMQLTHHCGHEIIVPGRNGYSNAYCNVSANSTLDS